MSEWPSREDRVARPTREGSRDVFSVALWRLDRLQRERNLQPDHWTKNDLVIEYARARALERLRRYAEAQQAYARVAQRGSLLNEAAAQAAQHMGRFAALSTSVAPDPLERVELIEARISHWKELAAEYRGSPYESLVWEELEAWGIEKVEAIRVSRGLEAAIAATHRLIEAHSTSKLYARHLIGLGDLYAEAARREFNGHRVGTGFSPARYDALLDRAFSAYELAGVQRRPEAKLEADRKIEALLAAHEGVRRHVQ